MDENAPSTPANPEFSDEEPGAFPVDEPSYEPSAEARLEAENADLKEKLLRTLAEMDNLRKRTEREIADAKTYAISNFARDLLPVVDNLGRALMAVPAGSDGSGLQALAEGVAMTERELLNVLKKHGVARLDPKGERFDPHLHQAIFEVDNANIPAGTIVEVAQSGYTIAGRVLRPAMVGVAKGGPKAGVPANGDGASVDRSV